MTEVYKKALDIPPVMLYIDFTVNAMTGQKLSPKAAQRAVGWCETVCKKGLALPLEQPVESPFEDD